MGSSVGGVEHRTSEEEVVAVRIAGIHSEVPETVAPRQGTIEIGGGTERSPLPFQQHVAQVAIATLPVAAIHIVIGGHPHQVIQIDFVGGLVLLVRQVQLISHLVRQEQCLVASLLITHCLAHSGYRQHHQGYHYLLHNHAVLKFHDAKLGRKTSKRKGFPLNSSGEIPIIVFSLYSLTTSQNSTAVRLC